MARRTDRQLSRLGLICIGVLVLVMAAAFNLQKFPGFRGTTFHADFADASGLKVGDIVQVAGIRVGRVNEINVEKEPCDTGAVPERKVPCIRVSFDVHDAKFGPDTTASIEVLNLLGQKYIRLDPKGDGQLPDGQSIALKNTSSAYDIVNALSDLTETTGDIDLNQMQKALTTLAETINAAAPVARDSFTGLSRISASVASRDAALTSLFKRAQNITTLLNQRKGDLVALMKSGDLVFKELIARRDAIHSLLINANKLAVQLHGVAVDNQKQIRPALTELNNALTFLNQRKALLEETIKNYGPYANILINVIGTGPWFDAYVPNLPGLVAGEFTPGKRTFKQ